MKQIAIVLALCVGAWYFFVGGRKLDEPMVRGYGQTEARAIAARDADRLCEQLSRKVAEDSTVVRLGGRGAISQSDFFRK